MGSHLVESLVARGVAVTVADNFSTGSLENLASVEDRVTIVRADLVTDDLTGLLSRGDFDTVIHTAGNASIPTSVAQPVHDLRTNILSTMNLLEAMRLVSPASALINISSATIYADGGGAPMTEDHPKGPVSPYGVSKLAAELYVGLYAHLHAMRTCSVRVFSVFGPRLRKQVVWDLMERLTSNPAELVIHSDGSERRDFNYVQNIIDAILVVAERAPMHGEAYNAGSRESISIAELARHVAAGLSLDPTIRHSAPRIGHARVWQADIGRLESLGYSEAVTFRDGLQRTVAWFKATNQGEGR